MAKTSEQLRQELREAEMTERKRRLEEYAKLPCEFDYEVRWHSDMTLTVSKHLNEASTVAREEHSKRWGGIPFAPQNGSMTYVLFTDLENNSYIVSVSGGLLVLNLGRSFDTEPFLLTPEDAQSFRDGVVPDHLRG